ncbi:MAG: type II toxin-antitoxin system VapC family toxin, partial [Ardenticatenaceae bacterium]
YWHLTSDSQLSHPARELFQETDLGLHQILVPGIVLIEMGYLVEKGRLDAALVDQVLVMLDTVGGSYTVAPLDQNTARAMHRIPRSAVPDMPDRIIAATAHQWGLPLITRDAKIHSAGVVTVIW